MRVLLAFLALGVLGLPLYAEHLPEGALPGPVAEALEGHTLDVEGFAENGFDARATLLVLNATRTTSTTGSFDEPIRAGPGEAYWHLDVRLVNEGNVAIGAHTHHFSAADDAHGNRTRRAEVGLKHGIFVMMLGPGEAAEGTLVFLLRDDATPTRLVWQGELAQAEAPVPPPLDSSV